MGYPIPLPIVRLVLICKATEICLLFCIHKVLSKLRCLVSKIHCLANQNKPDNGQRNRVSQHVLIVVYGLGRVLRMPIGRIGIFLSCIFHLLAKLIYPVRATVLLTMYKFVSVMDGAGLDN